MRSQEEINRQIEGLKKVKSSIPHYSAFGENNWERIDIQISILDGSKRYSNYSNAKPPIESLAYDAKEWLNGSGDDLFEL